MATHLQKRTSMNRTLLIVTLFAALIAGCKKSAPATARTRDFLGHLGWSG